MNSQQANKFLRELEISKAAALQAGQILLAHYRQPVEIWWKAPGDPVTAADQEASAFLLRTLKKEFPTDDVLSEEQPRSATNSSPRMWIIDPMDGTREFINHVDEFSVMIGLVMDGKPVAGVIHQPVTGKLYYGAAGAGAFLQESGRDLAIHASDERDPSRMTVAISRSHHTADVNLVCSRLGIERLLPSGSLGLKAGLISCGKAHLYIHAGSETSIWDTCAANIILSEAGGRMTDCDGGRLLYDPAQLRHARGVVASSGVIHERIVEAINDVRTIAGG
jgi:3'(2'), 5'-bisphosphate nucleotidase